MERKNIVVDLEEGQVNGECVFALKDRVKAHEQGPWWRRLYNVFFTRIREDQKKLSILYDVLCPEEASEYQNQPSKPWKKNLKITEIPADPDRRYHPILSRMKLFAQKYFSERKKSTKKNLKLVLAVGEILDYTEEDRKNTYRAQEALKMKYTMAHLEIRRILEDESPVEKRGECIAKIENKLEEEVKDLRSDYKTEEIMEDFNHRQRVYTEKMTLLKSQHLHRAGEKPYYFSRKVHALIVSVKNKMFEKLAFSTKEKMEEPFTHYCVEDIERSKKEIPNLERKEAVTVLRSILTDFKRAFSSPEYQKEINMRQSIRKNYRLASKQLRDLHENDRFDRVICQFLGERIYTCIREEITQLLDSNFLRQPSDPEASSYALLQVEHKQAQASFERECESLFIAKHENEARLPEKFRSARKDISGAFLKAVLAMEDGIGFKTADQLVLSKDEPLEQARIQAAAIISAAPLEYKKRLEDLVRRWEKIISGTVQKAYDLNAELLACFSKAKLQLEKMEPAEVNTSLDDEMRNLLKKFSRDNPSLRHQYGNKLDEVRTAAWKEFQKEIIAARREDQEIFKQKIRAFYFAFEMKQSSETLAEVRAKSLALLLEKEKEKPNTFIYSEFEEWIEEEAKKADEHVKIIGLYDEMKSALEVGLNQNEQDLEQLKNLLEEQGKICKEKIAAIRKGSNFLDEREFLSAQEKRVHGIETACHFKMALLVHLLDCFERIEMAQGNKKFSYAEANLACEKALVNFAEVSLEICKQAAEDLGEDIQYQGILGALKESYLERIRAQLKKSAELEFSVVEKQIRAFYEAIDPAADEGGERWVQGEETYAKSLALIERHYKAGETKAALLLFLKDFAREMEHRRPYRKNFKSTYECKQLSEDEIQEVRVLEEIGADGGKLRDLILQQFNQTSRTLAERNSIFDPLVKEYRRLAKKYHTDKNLVGLETEKAYSKIIIWLNGFHKALKELIQDGFFRAKDPDAPDNPREVWLSPDKLSRVFFEPRLWYGKVYHHPSVLLEILREQGEQTKALLKQREEAERKRKELERQQAEEQKAMLRKMQETFLKNQEVHSSLLKRMRDIRTKFEQVSNPNGSDALGFSLSDIEQEFLQLKADQENFYSRISQENIDISKMPRYIVSFANFVKLKERESILFLKVVQVYEPNMRRLLEFTIVDLKKELEQLHKDMEIFWEENYPQSCRDASMDGVRKSEISLNECMAKKILSVERRERIKYMEEMDAEIGRLSALKDEDEDYKKRGLSSPHNIQDIEKRLNQLMEETGQFLSKSKKDLVASPQPGSSRKEESAVINNSENPCAMFSVRSQASQFQSVGPSLVMASAGGGVD